MDEPAANTEYRLVRHHGGKRSVVFFRRFDDGSAYVSGDEEVIFEGTQDAWRSGWQALLEKGYRPIKAGVSGSGVTGMGPNRGRMGSGLH